MGRKKNKGNKKKYSYRDARMAFYKQNYALAEKILRQAHIKTEEAGLAKQLKVKILQHKALDAFEQKDYEATIELAQGVFDIQAKAGYPLPKEKSSILIGIAHLYLGEYAEAANYLSIAAQHEHIQGFRFYELLALLYQNAKTIDYTAFQNQYAEDYAVLEADRKTYLQIAYHLVRNEEKEASQILENYPHTSHSHLLNNKALQAILKEEPLEENPKIKGLYKVLLDLPLNPNEQAYLSYFDECNAFFEENYTEQLQVKVQEKLEVNTALDAQHFAEVLKRTSPEQQPFIVYNQVAAIYNDENFKLAARTIKQHEKHFFKVPESIQLFLCTAIRSEGAKQSLVLKTLNTQLDEWGGRYTEEQLDSIGWLVKFFMLSKKENTRPNALKVIQQILEKYPSMIGLKVWGICYYAMQTTGLLKRQKPMPQIVDAFSYPNLKDNQDAFLEELKDFLTEFLNLDRPFFSIGGKKKTGDYLTILSRIINLFDITIHQANIHPKTKQVVLQTYKLLLDYTDKALDIFLAESVEPIYKDLKEGYRYALEHFEEYSPDSPYFKDYQIIELKPEIEVLKELIKDKYFWEIKTEYQQLIKAGKDVVIIKALTAQITRMRFDEQEADHYGGLMQLFVDDNANTALEKMNALMTPYDEVANNEYLSFLARQFHGAVLKIMLANKDIKYFPIMQAYVRRYQDALSTINAPLVYNTVAAFLEQVLRLKKKHANLAYDSNLMQKLTAYIGRIAKERKLKGLANKYKKIQKAFN